MKPAAGATADVPLCVDLDGTILRGDAGVESALALLKRNPLFLFAMLWWARRGWAPFKREVARRVELDVTHMPCDTRVLAWVREQRAHRACLLVTASDALLAAPIARHLGVFDEVLASDGHTNLVGPTKAAALVERFGAQGFDYIGNSRSDLAVWPHARHVIVANAKPGLLRRIRAGAEPAHVFPRQDDDPGAWLAALRPRHWIKNVLLFAPLIGAHQLDAGALVLMTALAWLLFGLCTSGTYLINDLLDLDADRRHPRKRQRALASGRLDLADAVAVAVVLIAGALLTAALALPATFLAWLVAYLVLTLAYSLRLKRLAVVDAVVLAGLFTIRILAGGAATGIAVSAWLLVLAMLLFFCLALLKRYAELRDLGPQHAGVPGRGYRGRHLAPVGWLGMAAGAAAVLTLGLYIASPVSHALYRQPLWLWLLCPLLAWWLIRAWRLAKRGQMHDDPVMFATRDAQSWMVLALGAVLVWLAA